MDELIERIESARSDADWLRDQGKDEDASVVLTLDDCDELARFLTKAFGAVMTGSRDDKIATDLACLSGAFGGDDDDE